MRIKAAKGDTPMKRGVMQSVLGIACALVIAAPGASAVPLLVQGWRQLNPKERYDTLQNYWRYQKLPEDRQRDVDKRYERWQSLSPAERARIRQNYERYRQLPPQDRERFQRKYEKWRSQEQPAH
jgi:hypothetical protein